MLLRFQQYDRMINGIVLSNRINIVFLFLFFQEYHCKGHYPFRSDKELCVVMEHSF